MTAPAISVLFAYRDRLPQFRHTLQSYQHWYGPTLEGVQLIMVDDTPTDSEALPRLLRELGLEGGPHRVVIVQRDGAHNPGVLYNQAGTLADAPLVALTNPENLHLGPVLQHAQEHWQSGHYLVYGCRALKAIPDRWEDVLHDPDRFHASWYQHTQHSARHLHFMTVLATDDFRRIGFDPAYDDGHAFEDNDFVRRIQEAQLHLDCYDEPAVGHQPHTHHWNAEYTERNRTVYAARWNP